MAIPITYSWQILVKVWVKLWHNCATGKSCKWCILKHCISRCQNERLAWEVFVEVRWSLEKETVCVPAKSSAHSRYATFSYCTVSAYTGGGLAKNHGLFLLFAWWNLHSASLSFSALFLPHFHLVAPWNWFLPACLLPLWAMRKLGRGRKREMEGPIFPSRRVSHSSLEGGFSCSPLTVFWTRTERICGHKCIKFGLAGLAGGCCGDG